MNRNLLDTVTASLPVPRRRKREIERELRAHLRESQRDLELAGWEPSAAARESLARLGDPDDIVEGFRRVYRPTRGRQVGKAFGLAGFLLAAVYGASGTHASATPAHHAPSHGIHSSVYPLSGLRRDIKRLP